MYRKYKISWYKNVTFAESHITVNGVDGKTFDGKIYFLFGISS